MKKIATSGWGEVKNGGGCGSDWMVNEIEGDGEDGRKS